MKKCLIVTAYLEGAELLCFAPSDYDCILCADGGLPQARKLGLAPDRLIGDFDSAPRPDPATEPAAADLVLLPCEKDVTDSEAAVDLAYEQGFRDITVLGGLGGRFDHAMGNLGVLAKYLGRTDRLVLEDGYNRVFLLAPGSYTIPKDRFQYLGLIAYNGPVDGLSVSGVKYPLSGHRLTADNTLGVSNQILGDTAPLSFADGTLLVIQSNDVAV
ncbi:MAG: thiamine diphosphokinase [Clostridia bacterium]|nr:thiamine diphosphokinase [Clostridia bacterium]